MSEDLGEDMIEIRQVWNTNFDSEVRLIHFIINVHPNVAIKTTFPGHMIEYSSNFKHTDSLGYMVMKSNVEVLTLIQLGLTITDNNGNLPKRGSKYCVWQFNFREFDLRKDPHVKETIDVLSNSGTNFEKIVRDGIDVSKFSNIFRMPGITRNSDVHLVTFNGLYDCGFLLKLLTGRELPETLSHFYHNLKCYFPHIYDIKHILKHQFDFDFGLHEAALITGAQRIGTAYQPGSDSLLTMRLFNKVKDSYFNGSVKQFAGKLLDDLDTENMK